MAASENTKPTEQTIVEAYREIKHHVPVVHGIRVLVLQQNSLI
jgi:hypothetical protein